MKKLGIVLILILGLNGLCGAQTKTFVQANVSVSNNRTYESLEVGATTGKNRLSVIAESYNKGNDLTIDSNRQYFGGIKYTRVVAVGKKLSLLMSGAALIHIDSDKSLSVEPGIGLEYTLFKNFSVSGSVSSPIHQNTTPFKSTQLKAGIGVQVRI